MYSNNLICIDPKLCQTNDFNTLEEKKYHHPTQRYKFELSRAVQELVEIMCYTKILRESIHVTKLIIFVH